MDSSSVSIGTKIRLYRQMKKLTIKQLAEEAGITSSMLSQIERDVANPSINTLRTLAEKLDVALFRFFVNDEVENQILVHPKDRRHIVENGIDYELLTPDMNCSMEFCQLTLAEGHSTEGSISRHEGEEVALVLKGSFMLSLEGVTYHMNEGDSIKIGPLMNHSWTNCGKGDAILVFSVTPPCF